MLYGRCRVLYGASVLSVARPFPVPRLPDVLFLIKYKVRVSSMVCETYSFNIQYNTIDTILLESLYFLYVFRGVNLGFS